MKGEDEKQEIILKAKISFLLPNLYICPYRWTLHFLEIAIKHCSGSKENKELLSLLSWKILANYYYW